MGPRCSVIIPTYRRPEGLAAVLRALAAQTEMDFEVIVASDGPPGESLSVAMAYSALFRSIQIRERPHGGRAAIRNFGASAASSDLLIFFDDDMRPAPGCVAAHLNHHRCHPDSLLGGNQLEDPLRVRTDFQAYKAELSRHWTRDIPRHDPLPSHAIFLTAAHFSIARRTFDLLRGFDERLTDCEDFDFAARAHLSGFKIFFRNDLIAWHDDYPTCRSYIRRQRDYRKALLTVFSLNRDLARFFPARRPIQPVGLKRTMFRILASDNWIRLIDEGLPVKLLPRTVRYRFYDYVVAAMGNYFPDAPMAAE